MLNTREFFAIDFEIGAAILRTKHFVANLYLHRDFLSVDYTAGTYRNNGVGLGFLLGRRGQKQTACRLFLYGYAFDNNFIE